MDWNLLFKRTNKAIKEEKTIEFNKLKEDLEKRRKKFNEDVKNLRKKETLLYRAKDRFFRIYPICITIFIVWLIPLIYIIVNASNPIFFVYLVVYCILTIPFATISFFAPTIKFLFMDFPKLLDELKVYASSQYIVAIMFLENRFVIPILRKVDKDNHFQYESGDYIVDKSASYITNGKVMLAFYLKGLPNPLKFNFSGYLAKYIQAKKDNPNIQVMDFKNELVDVAFSSENLREFKKNKLFQEFFRDYLGEANKLLFAILGFAIVTMIIFFIMYIMKK